MSLYRTPFGLLKPFRARLRHFVAIGSLALSSGGFAGCTQQQPSPPPDTASPSSTAAWDTVLKNWWQAATEPDKSAPARAPGTPVATPSRDEIARLARQHPAWKLADALQENRLQPLQFQAIAPGTARDIGIALPGFDVNFSDPLSSSGNSANSSLPEPAVSAPATPTQILDFGELNDTARTQQATALTDFLRSVATRQEDWQRDYRAILQTALGENVEAAAKRLPNAVPLVLPSPEIQLEMTNLRLRLLRNVFTTEEEREAARSRLRELLLQWRAALREQEKTRSLELQRLRTQEPARIREEGLIRIEQELAVIKRTQQELRAAVAAEHRARLEEEFGDERTRLALNFPQITDDEFPTSGTTDTGNAASAYASTQEKIIFNRTLFPFRASDTVLPGMPSASSTSTLTRSAQIRALRRQAWSDATRQAQMSVRLGY